MNNSYRIGLVGFKEFEQSMFESFFKLSARREKSFEYCEQLNRCHYLIVNADQGVAREIARDTLPTPYLILIITKELPWIEWKGAYQVHRPINLMQILKVMDQMPLPKDQRSTKVSAKVITESLRDEDPETEFPATEFPHTELPPVTDFMEMEEASQFVDIEPLVRTNQLPLQVTAFHNPETFSNAVLAPGDERFDHILVVDDSDVARRFVQSRLKRFGFKVHLAHSGEEAIQKIAERQFEFVFLDVQMSGMDGYATCRQIKKLPLTGNRYTPVVVMLSSKVGTTDKIKGTLAGCDAYLSKPLAEEDLIHTISSHDNVFQRGFESTYSNTLTPEEAAELNALRHS